MKIFNTLIAAFLLNVTVQAQVVNRSEVDCNNQSQSIYSVLSTGKALIVASEGIDCSICQSKAPGLQNWAANNASQVTVWAAMTFTYSSNTPNCAQVGNWVSNYNWTDIFTFIDQNEFYFQSGTPIYWVYSPADSSRQGPFGNENSAYQAALNAASPNISKAEQSLKAITYHANTHNLFLENLPKENLQVALIGLNGQVLLQKHVQQSSAQLALADVPAGVYLLQLSLAGAQVNYKLYKP